jgi:CheY-like chemotaxis protein
MSEPGGAEKPLILVAEGDILTRHAIADYLRDCGYKVIEAAAGEEALAVVARQDLPLAALLCDVELPGPLNGFALAKEVRARRPGLPVILAASAAAAASGAADLCGDGPQLARPYEPQAVIAYVKRLFAKRDGGG